MLYLQAKGKEAQKGAYNDGSHPDPSGKPGEDQGIYQNLCKSLRKIKISFILFQRMPFLKITLINAIMLN